MKNPNYLLYQLLLKYHVYDETPEVYRCYYGYLFEAVINEIFDEIPCGRVVAIRGGGYQGKKIIANLSSENLKKVTYLIDKRPSAAPGSIYSISPYEDRHFDIIIIGSYAHRAEIRREYETKGIDVIDPFEKMIRQTFGHDESYFIKEDNWYRHITYLDINECIWAEPLLRNNTEKHRKKAVRLFAYLVEIKDFLNARKYLDLFLKQYTEEYQRLDQFLKEVERLFFDMQQYIEQKGNKDIVINWVDDVCAEDFYGAPGAEELSKDALVFDNAYTVTPWTHYTFDAMFTGQYPMESGCLGRMNEQRTAQNNILLKLLKDKGYHFMYYAFSGMYSKMFPADSYPKYLPGFEKVLLGARSMSECSTRNHWNALCDRVIGDRPLCCLVHNLSETHRPFVYVGRDVEIVQDGAQREKHMEGLASMIEELKWYETYEKSGLAYQIYLSDHGEEWETKHIYDKEHVNVALFVKAANVNHGRFQKMVSLVDFYKLIKELLDSKDFSADGLARKYVVIENYDHAYEDDIIAELNIGRKKLMGIMNLLQVKAVITEDGYTYARYANGREIYLHDGKAVKPDEFENREDADEIKKFCSENFVDIFKDERFRASRMLYEYLDVLPEEKTEW